MEVREAHRSDVQHFTRECGLDFGEHLRPVFERGRNARSDVDNDSRDIRRNTRRRTIENQLEPSDHTHLGQLLTYLVGMDADIGVWICAEPRDEHIKTVEWLNTFDQKQIYLVQVRFVQIGTSDRAPMFEVVAGPDESNAQVAQSKASDNANAETRRQFWKELSESIDDQSNPFYGLQPSPYHYMGRPLGKGGFSVNCVLPVVSIFSARKDGTSTRCSIGSHRSERFITYWSTMEPPDKFT